MGIAMTNRPARRAPVIVGSRIRTGNFNRMEYGRRLLIPDGYDLDHQISRGDSAQVWLAKSPTGMPVVLKIAANIIPVQRRFKREIDAMQVAAGTHVMPILDYDDSYGWYSMPVAARTLHEAEVPTDFKESLLVLEAITAALRPIHSVGQVHRDLKPQNILWMDDVHGARWVVADFGIVRNAPGRTSEQLTRKGGLTGSEGWAAPEQYRGAHHSTITADVFGAGAIVSWMLTGERPVYGDVEYPSDPRLKAVLRRATSPDATGRYSTLEDLLKAVKDSAIASTASLESLIRARDWSRVSSYILGQPSQLIRVVKALPQLEKSQVQNWFSADRSGLISAVREACDILPSNTRGLTFSEIDSFLSWGVIVLRILVKEGEYDAAERVATALFGATAGIHQFMPAKVIIDWLSGLDQPAQLAMETALHSSSSWEFFKEQASNRWASRGDSDLVRRLREE